MNYFDLFGLPKSPVIDRTVLAKKYFELQKQNHPDFFTKESSFDQENALAISADINKAFRIFSNEDLTLEYFLQLEGAIQPGEKYVLPPDFLMEMMELNEELAGAKMAVMEEKLGQLENVWMMEVKEHFKTGSADKHTAADLEKLKAFYYKKKYLKRILDRLDD